jgi:hypothetical protein
MGIRSGAKAIIYHRGKILLNIKLKKAENIMNFPVEASFSIRS